MNKIFAASSLIALLAVAQSGGAQAATTNFWFSAPGVSAAGSFTYDPTKPDAVGGGFPITNITGTFTDTNNGLDIVGATISGPVPAGTGYSNPDLPSTPTAFTLFPVASGLPPQSNGVLSYDNLFYPNGSPIVCIDLSDPSGDWPFSGGFLDAYGILFDISGGAGTVPNEVVDFWSDGYSPAGSPIYGVAVATAAQAYDYEFVGIAAGVPEPATWAMMLMGFAGIGFAGCRRARKRAAAAV